MSGLYETLRSARQVAPEEDLFAQAAVTGARTPEQAVRNAELTDSVFTQAVRGGLRGFGSSAQELVGLGGELAGRAPDYAAADDLAARAGTSGVQDVRQIGSLRDALSFGQYATGNAIGSMLVPAAGAAAGLLARNKMVGSMVGAGLGAFVGEAGEQARTLRTDPALAGMSAGDRAVNAGAVGAVNAGLEAITPARAVMALTKAPAKGLGKELVKGSLREGSTEAAQNTTGQLGHMLANPNKEFEFGDVANAAATGAVGGGGIQLATRGAQEARDRIPELLQNIRDRKDQAVTAVVDKKNEVIDTTRQIADDGLNAIEEIRQFAMRKAPLKDPDGMPDLTDAPEDQDPVAVAQKIRTFQEEGRRAVDEFVKANPDLGFDTATPEGRAAAFQEMQKRTYEAEVEPLMQEAVKDNVKPEGKASRVMTAVDADLIDSLRPVMPGASGRITPPQLMVQFSELMQQVMTGARPMSDVAWRVLGDSAPAVLKATQDVLERHNIPLASTAEEIIAARRDSQRPLEDVILGYMKPELLADRDARKTVIDMYTERLTDLAKEGKAGLTNAQRQKFGQVFTEPDAVYATFLARERVTQRDAPVPGADDLLEDAAPDTRAIGNEGNSDTADIFQSRPELARWKAHDEALAEYDNAEPLPKSQAEKLAKAAQKDLGPRFRVTIEPEISRDGEETGKYVVRTETGQQDAPYSPLEFTEIADRASNLSRTKADRVKHGIITMSVNDRPFNVSAHSLVTKEMSLQPKGESNVMGLERIAQLFSAGVSKLLMTDGLDGGKPFPDFARVDPNTGQIGFDFPKNLLVWRMRDGTPITYGQIRQHISREVSKRVAGGLKGSQNEAAARLEERGEMVTPAAVEQERVRFEQEREFEKEGVPPTPGDTMREQTAGEKSFPQTRVVGVRADGKERTVEDAGEAIGLPETSPRTTQEETGLELDFASTDTEVFLRKRAAAYAKHVMKELRGLEMPGTGENQDPDVVARALKALGVVMRELRNKTVLSQSMGVQVAATALKITPNQTPKEQAKNRKEPFVAGRGSALIDWELSSQEAPSLVALRDELNAFLQDNPGLREEAEKRLAAVRKESPRPAPTADVNADVKPSTRLEALGPQLGAELATQSKTVDLPLYEGLAPKGGKVPSAPNFPAPARDAAGETIRDERNQVSTPEQRRARELEAFMREVVDNIDQMFPRTPAEQRADLKKALDSDPPTNVREAASRLGVNPRGVNANALARDRATIDSFLSRVLGADYAWHFRDVLTSGSWMKMNGIDTIVISTMAMDRVGVARHEAMHAMAARLQEVQPRAFRALSAAASSPHVMSQLRRILANEPAALDQLKDPEEAVAYMYQYWADGKLTIGPQSRTLLQRFADFVAAAYGAMTGIYRADPEAAEKLLMAFNRGEFANKARLKDDVDQVMPEGLIDKLEKHFAPIMKGFDRIWVATEARMRAFGDPMVDRIAEGFYGSKGTPGFVQARVFETNKWLSRLGKVLDGATEKELENILRAMRQQSTNILGGSPRMDAVRAYLDDIHEYQVRSNVGTWVEDPQRGWVMQPMGKVQNYFPRAWDFEKVAADKAGLQAILEKGGYRKDEARDIVLALSRPGDTNSLNSRDQTSALMFYAPHTKQRQIKGIPESELAPYMKDDLREILAQYTSAAVRRAEYSSRFGMNGNVIENNLADSQLTNPQLAEVRKMISALDGTIGNDIPETMRKVMSNAMAYQNIRLLPLALFSSLSDSIGIGVRGGTLKEVGTAFVEGLKGIIPGGKKDTSSEAYHLAVAAGAIQAATDFDMANYIVGSQYMSQKVRKVNDWLFKVNGMESWNRTMRIQASAAAEQFLIRHTTSPNEHSARYLEELDLKPSDVQVQNGQLVLNDKTKNAVAMWVDGAILRPSAALRPVWMSDPHWMLVSHLKQFTYNFQQVILKRVAQEAGHGNLRPFMMLLGYMPAVLAADALRVFLTPSDDDDNWRKSWDWKDYALSAVTRAGVTGTAQFGADMGTRGVEAALGPTVEQLIKLSKAGTDNVDQTDRWWAKQTIPGVRYF